MARTIVFGAAHWHVPLYAERLLARHEIIGIEDQAPELVADFSAAAQVEVTADRQALLDLPNIELAYVFGPHNQMAGTCLDLIDRRIPFVVEKPCGISLAELDAVCAAARQAKVPAAIPLIQRDAPIERWLTRAGDISYFRASFIAGPPDRYLGSSPWMLQPEKAGGGCATNLAPHFVDLFQRLVGTTETTVWRSSSSVLHGGEVEDHATLVLRTKDGREGIIEIGYAFPPSPLKRSSSYSAAGSAGFAEITGSGLASFTSIAGETDHTSLDVDSDPLYAGFVDAVADRLDDGFGGLATLDELRCVMSMIWEVDNEAPEY
jgi:predicted dehydrogenase